MATTLILINPWIYDFAAYDLWSKPLGLLYLGSYLRRCGFQIRLIDCLDVHHPGMDTLPVRRAYGTGKYRREPVPKPEPLKHVPRAYSRYGIAKTLFEDELQAVVDPAAILVTSSMTYWYPGVRDAIALARKIHPNVPVILGGIYARLCQEHARQYVDADHVFSRGGIDSPDSAGKMLTQFGIHAQEIGPFEPRHPYPAFDLLHRLEYVTLRTSMGCPYRCRYCASPFLNPDITGRDPLEVLDEILYWHDHYSVRDFAFYDDALLFRSEGHISVLLEHLMRLKMDLRFHTPNALHIREISPEMAGLLYHAGFRTIRLGLETSDMDLHQELDKKVSEGEFETAVENLKKAGFDKKSIGAYILMGLPGQSVASVMETIEFAGTAGATPYLAEYSPLPHTPLWEKALIHSQYDLAHEPLFHNNTLLPCWDEDKITRVPELKKRVLQYRHD
ncbi:MAG: radical SAM protein [Deltaproteobacteria bacterium]|nr:radical SAM protein [Deltaproteobacteria bacterium]